MNLLTRRACRVTSLSFLIISLSIPTFGQPAAGSEQGLVDQLVEQWALKYQLEEAPGDIRMQFEQNPLNLPPQKNEQMLELFSDAYRTDLLLDDFKSALKGELNDEYAETLAQKLDDPDIRAATEAQQEFYTLQGKRKRIVARYEMEQQTPSPERSGIVTALVDTTTAATGSVESSIVILRSVIKALGGISEQHQFTDQQIDAVTDNFRTQMQAGASQQTNNRMMVTFYNVDTNALEHYVEFMESDTGQWLDNAISQSFQIAYEAASERFLQAINAKQ